MGVQITLGRVMLWQVRKGLVVLRGRRNYYLRQARGFDAEEGGGRGGGGGE